MIRFFHDQPGRSNRMDEAFDRRHSASPQSGPFHYRGIHPLHAVQLPLCPSPCVEEPGLFKKADGALDREDCRTAMLKNCIAGGQCVGKARSLSRSHGTSAGAAVSKDKGTWSGQLRRRSLAC